jgi:hypothetical protein
MPPLMLTGLRSAMQRFVFRFGPCMHGPSGLIFSDNLARALENFSAVDYNFNLSGLDVLASSASPSYLKFELRSCCTVYPNC